MRLRTWLVLVFCLGAGSAPADEIVLANGDKLNGEIVEWAVDHVVVVHPQLGEIRLSLDQLDIDTGEPPKKGWFDTNFMRGWNRSINIGLNGKQGNTVTTNLTAGFDFNYEDDFKRWLFTGRYFYNRSDDGDDENNARVDLRRDFLIPESRWFAFTAFRYQYDQFESWQHRTLLGLGPGFHLVESETQALDTLLGVNFTREFGERQTEKGEAMWGIEWKWTISERQSFTFKNYLYVEFRPDAGELRNDTLAEWKVALIQEPSLSLLIGAQNEYETDLEPGDKPNDLKYYLALGVDF